jgi:hypothetical protein
VRRPGSGGNVCRTTALQAAQLPARGAAPARRNEEPPVPEELVTDPNIRAEIEALVTEHAWMQDNHQTHRLAELYTEGGRYLGVGPDLVGRAAITAYGARRAGMTQRRARHVVSNLRLVADGPKRIRGGCMVTLFRSDGEALAPADPIAVADAQDVYALCEDGRWRLEERRIVLAFESAAHKAG